MQLTIKTDGGSRGNPGESACAFVVYLGDEEIASQGRYLGRKTNNQAEYHAVLESLAWLQAQINAGTFTASDLTVAWQADSLLIVSQLQGKWKIKDLKMLVLRTQAMETLENIGLSSFSFTYIPREQNTAADALVNQVLDERAADLAIAQL